VNNSDLTAASLAIQKTLCYNRSMTVIMVLYTFPISSVEVFLSHYKEEYVDERTGRKAGKQHDQADD